MGFERRLPGRAARIAALMVLGAVSLARSGAAQAVNLRIRPRVGDTLRTRFEQQMEITGVTKHHNADTTMTRRSWMLMLSRVVVQVSDNDGVTVVALIDSVDATAQGGRPSISPDSMRHVLQGRRTRMRFTPQGSATMVDAAPGVPADLQSIASQMPATLPAQAVSVGDTWSEDMAIPVAGTGAGTGTASSSSVHTVYRLDSLSRDQGRAYISMRGTYTRDAAPPEPAGLREVSTGTITGSLVMDRKRGWWMDSRAAIVSKSTVLPRTPGSAPPVYVQMHITTRLRVVESP